MVDFVFGWWSHQPYLDHVVSTMLLDEKSDVTSSELCLTSLVQFERTVTVRMWGTVLNVSSKTA